MKFPLVWRSVALVLLFALTFGFGCGKRAYVSSSGRYDRIPKDWQAKLLEARSQLDAEDLDGAYMLLSELATQNPRILPVRVFLQEIELRLLEERGRAGRLSVPSPDQAHAWLSNYYLTQSEANPSPESLILAARLEKDARSALALLDQAEALDPRCVWIPYARAWCNFVDYRFTPAEDAIREAFKLDSGHLQTMRLQAVVLTAAGESAGAMQVLSLWLRRTAGDPLVSAEQRGEALLDLASLKVLNGETKDALRILDAIDPRVIAKIARLDQVRAAALEDRDAFELAHEAIRRSQLTAPEDPLPLIQKARLYARQGDDENELATWNELLEHLEEHPDSAGFSALIYRLQALTRLQRHERKLAEESRKVTP